MFLLWELMEFCKLVNRGAFEFGIGCLDFHLLSLLTFQSGVGSISFQRTEETASLAETASSLNISKFQILSIKMEQK